MLLKPVHGRSLSLPLLLAAAVLGSTIAATGVFVALSSRLFSNPLGVPEPEHLVALGLRVENIGRFDLFSREFDDIAGRYSLGPVAGVGHERVVVNTGSGAAPAVAAFITEQYFHVLGLQVSAGRPLTALDFEEGAPLAAIAVRSGPADPVPLLQHEVRVGNATATIVGVAPEGFLGTDLHETPRLLLPLPAVRRVKSDPGYLWNPGDEGTPHRWLNALVRLPPGMGMHALPEQFRAGDAGSLPPIVVASAGERAYSNRLRTDIQSLNRSMLGASIAMVILGTAALSLIVLTRWERTRADLAVRVTLGASRRNIIGVGIQSVAWPLAAALMLAAILAYWAVEVVGTLVLPGGIKVAALDISLVPSGIAAMASAWTASAGLIVAITVVRGVRTYRTLVLNSRPEVARFSIYRTRRWYSLAAIATAMFLLGTAAVLTTAVASAISADFGFGSRRVLLASVNPAAYGYQVEQLRAFYQNLAGELSVDPRLESAAVARRAGGMSDSGALVLAGERIVVGAPVLYFAVERDYFSVMGLARLDGRLFGDVDGPSGKPVAVVSASLARALSPARDIVGTDLWLGSPGHVTVVGVVSDLSYRLDDSRHTVYLPDGQRPRAGPIGWLFAEASNVSAGKEAIRAALRNVDPNVNLTGLGTVEELVRSRHVYEDVTAKILGAFGSVAIAMAAVAVFALMSAIVAGTRRESAIRLALGATGRALVAGLCRQAGVLILSGVGIGSVAMWAFARVLGTGALVLPLSDLLRAVISTAGILAIAMACSLVPAIISLLRLEPGVALRE